MGYVFQLQDALTDTQRQESQRGRAILAGQLGLLKHLLKLRRGQRFLDIGCGAGHLLQRLEGSGVQLTGLDAALPMLDLARDRLGHRVDLQHGTAEDLPFDDNAFHYVSLVQSLEFVEDPGQALSEACRVAKDGVFIGLINRYALLSLAYRLQGICLPTIYNRARFYSIWQIRQFINCILGEVPFEWRTLYVWPPVGPSDTVPVVTQGWRHRLPFGIIAGIKIVPVPCFRTTPLTLQQKIKSGTGRWVETGTCNGASSHYNRQHGETQQQPGANVG